MIYRYIDHKNIIVDSVAAFWTEISSRMQTHCILAIMTVLSQRHCKNIMPDIPTAIIRPVCYLKSDKIIPTIL